MSHSDGRAGHIRPASEFERKLLTDGRGTADDFPDPFGEHTIEWWVWDGERLIPASEGDMRAIEEYERSRAALRQLAQWERSEHSWRGRLHSKLTLVTRAFRRRGSRQEQVSPRDESSHECATPSNSLGETP